MAHQNMCFRSCERNLFAYLFMYIFLHIELFKYSSTGSSHLDGQINKPFLRTTSTENITTSSIDRVESSIPIRQKSSIFKAFLRLRDSLGHSCCHQLNFSS